MRVFGVVSGRRGVDGFSGPLLGVSSGDGGFNGCCSGASSGVVGFKVATLSRLVREKVRPARSKHPKIGAYLRAGRVFSRTGSRGIPPGEHCRAAALAAGPSTGSVNPSMRSYTHLAEAGHGRPTRPQQPTPQRKALTKGRGSPVKAVTSLDNGRKWRVYAGRTLELLR